MTSTTEQTLIDTMVGFGRVVTVRPVPTRGVTQIVIEIPDEFHVQATSLLFNKDAFVLAATPGVQSAYGVVPLAKMGADDQEPPVQNPTPVARQPGVRSRGLVHDVDPSRWLGIECQTAAFMHWLGVSTSQEAAEKVRDLCGVTSRRDIARSAQAFDIFITKIYQPYNQHTRFNRQMLQGAQQNRAGN